VAYILYSLYAPHPIAINPFKSVLFDTFTKERNVAVQLVEEGQMSDNEQLVWVLWKILKGDGDHVSGGFSLSIVACHARSSSGHTLQTLWLESHSHPN
jgi:hypothetical protein